MMQYIKTQVEVNFTQILDLGEAYKPIFAPYLRDAELQLSDEGGRFRSVTLIFRDEGYSVFCEWNRLLLTCDGQAALVNTHGALFVFSQIMEKLRELPLFGRCINIAYGQCGLLPSDEPADYIADVFRQKYMGAQFPVMDKITSGNITADFRGESNGRIFLGIYKDQDIATYGLLPINSSGIRDLLSQAGLFLQSIQIASYEDNERNFLGKIKDMDENNLAIFKNIGL